MRDENGKTLRGAPNTDALTACQLVVREWKDKHNISMNLDDAAWTLASRARSWIGPKSVAAGVDDIMGALRREMKVNQEAILELGEHLARRLVTEGLIGIRKEVPVAPAKPIDFGPGTRA